VQSQTSNHMKKIITKKLSFILAAVVFLTSACSTKRYHNRGFHIAWGSNKQSNNETSNPKIAKVSPRKPHTSSIAESTINTTVVQPTTVEGPSPTNILSNHLFEHNKTNPSYANTVVKNHKPKHNIHHSSQSVKSNTANNTNPKNQKYRTIIKSSDSPIWGILSFVCSILALYILLFGSSLGFELPLTIIVGILLALAAMYLGLKGQNNKLELLAFLGTFIGCMAMVVGFVKAYQ
jgi:type IV secretory pathway VirB2 component (pilin)